VASGALVKPGACEGCGTKGTKLEAHHRDYAKPLDTEWLCHDCHAEWHLEADDMEHGQWRFAFKKSEAAEAYGPENIEAYLDPGNWPSN
jgi:hypothetical protein